MEFRDAVNARHSEYVLDDRLDLAGVTADDIVGTIRGIASAVPSSFNAQSARMVVLIGEDHRRFWDIVAGTLRARIGEERFARTAEKLKGFRVAAGTVLFYEVDARTEELVGKYPSYAEQLPVWAEHGNAMMQFAVWTALYDMGLGANIQHYNPLVDAETASVFGIPDGWRLVAQMVFGRAAGPAAGGKPKLPGDEIVLLGHARDSS